MVAADIGTQRVAVWGLGREGRAAIDFLREQHPHQRLLLMADAPDRQGPKTAYRDVDCVFGADEIAGQSQLDRKHAAQAFGTTGPDRRQAFGNALERQQPEADLQHGCKHQRGS